MFLFFVRLFSLNIWFFFSFSPPHIYDKTQKTKIRICWKLVPVVNSIINQIAKHIPIIELCPQCPKSNLNSPPCPATTLVCPAVPCPASVRFFITYTPSKTVLIKKNIISFFKTENQKIENWRPPMIWSVSKNAQPTDKLHAEQSSNSPVVKNNRPVLLLGLNSFLFLGCHITLTTQTRKPNFFL